MPPLSPPSFIVLFDPTLQLIREMAASLPKCLIFAFCTIPPKELTARKPPDLGRLKCENLVMPFYIGNFKKRDQAAAVSAYVKNALEPWHIGFTRPRDPVSC